MQVKVIETGRTEELHYRSWNGIRYGKDEAEEIVLQYLNAPYDRASQAYIMSYKDYKFWMKYLKHLAVDEKVIRGLYQQYHSVDVEDALQTELQLVQDDPAKHHQARRQAINYIRDNCKLKSKSPKRAKYAEFLGVRLSSDTDSDIIDIIRQAEREGKHKSTVIKDYVRLGIASIKAQEEQRQADIETLKHKGWL